MLILSSVFSAFPLELSVSFSSTEYSVDEDAGTVSVCLELSDDQLTREAAFTVELAAVSDTAIGELEITYLYPFL